MAGRGRGMAGNQGHSAGPGVGMGGPGGAGGGDERRELRRPIVGQPGPNAEDLTRGMAKMEPFRDDFGRFGGFGGAGPHGGGQAGAPGHAMGPPRPAPNADGWSSGENQFGQQQYQGQWNTGMLPQNLNGAHQQFPPHHNPQFASHDQQNMNAQMAAAAHGWGFNVGASEFVPKNTNLSVAAQEFVPRHMPRNTSYWAQQQQQQQQQQEMMYQQQQQQQHNQYEIEQNQAYQQEQPSFETPGMQPEYNQIPSNTQQSHSHHQGSKYSSNT